MGSEGWGRVTRVLGNDENDNRISEGSLVTLGASGYGTMRSSLWIPSHDLLTVPEAVWEKAGPAGCTLFQLGGTAMRMLTDFVPLQPGDVVIQNAGNSGVGIMASQLSQAMFGASLVSVIRRGSKSAGELDQLMDYLKSTGKCSLVAIEEDLANDQQAVRQFQQQLRDLSPSQQLPKLAFNAVGGPSAQLLLKCLDAAGTMVTYGGMSGQGIQVGTPQLIFKDLRVLGYWHSRWMIQHLTPEKQEMVDALCQAMMKDEVILSPVKVFSLRDVQQGLQWQAGQSNQAIRSKLVWDCQE
jgi:mitochondrial enoyl-[acyl-carrier protein] reductase / trans-2-enoyl-CoA reductase